jgi:hypothetical protein
VEGGRRERCGGAGAEEEAVEELGWLEQADEGTWESQGDVDGKEAKQNNIYMKYKEGNID